MISTNTKSMYNRIFVYSATEEERKLYDEYKVAKARITVMINQLKAKIESKK